MDYPHPLDMVSDQRHEQLNTHAAKDELLLPQHQGTPQHLITVPDEISLAC